MKPIKKRIYRRRVCLMCPKWQQGNCLIYAKITAPNAPACNYGRKLIGRQLAAAAMKERRERERRRKGAARRRK